MVSALQAVQADAKHVLIQNRVVHAILGFTYHHRNVILAQQAAQVAQVHHVLPAWLAIVFQMGFAKNYVLIHARLVQMVFVLIAILDILSQTIYVQIAL